MKFSALLLALSAFAQMALSDQAWAAEEDKTPEEAFEAAVAKARVEYRLGLAKKLETADRVMICLVDFEWIKAVDGFEEGSFLPIAPYGGYAKVLEEKELTAAERQPLLQALARQIAVPEQSGGAFCHDPFHGVRIFKGETLLYEGTFCWQCANFSFAYPEGAEWLDATPELEAIFRALMPVREKNRERFDRKHSGAPEDSPPQE